MLYSKDMLDKVKELLEDPELESLLGRASGKLASKLKGEDVPELFEIIEEGLKSFGKPCMYISRASIGDEGKDGFAIEFESHEGEILVDSAYRFVDIGNDNKAVGISMINKIREMAYMGYELHQGRDNKVIDVFKKM